MFSQTSPVRRRLSFIADTPRAIGPGVACVFHVAVECAAFIAILAVWYFGWMAVPASAADLSGLVAAKGSIFLGTVMLGIAYLMLLAVRPSKPEQDPHSEPHGDVPRTGGDL